MTCSVRPLRREDLAAVAAMRRALAEEGGLEEHLAELARLLAIQPAGVPGASTAFVAWEASRRVGFAEVQLRSHAEGCWDLTDAGHVGVGYLEALWVEADRRRSGVGRALVVSCEAWALSQGSPRLASDALLDNRVSRTAHRAMGFTLVEQAAHFVKELGPTTRPPPTLFIFGGLPGTGKTTLSMILAAQLRAVHLRIDTIEQALRRSGATLSGPEGYLIAHALAADHLRAGLSVVADSVNPWALTRRDWRAVAVDLGLPLVEVEVICSDSAEHQRRVEGRTTTIPDLVQPTWEQVQTRDVQPWPEPHVVFDTAGCSVEQSSLALLELLKLGARH